jgi:hypothetical protein
VEGPLWLSMGRKGLGLAVVVVAIGVCAPPAWAAFPGRDGELVVTTGNGLELMAPATGAARSICADVALCGHPAQPTFSPNGQAIAFVDRNSGRPVVIAADGSCLWCLLGTRLTALTGSDPAFTASGQVTVVRNGLWSVSLTGGGARRVITGPVNAAVWSSRGLVGLVRAGWVWVGRPGRGTLRRVARGRSPSFSPNGGSIAFARDGYVWVMRVRDGAERRLVRGAAPAWSPTGRRIAYIGPGGAVEIVAAQGGRSSHVGSVHGAALDWQPVPPSARRACSPPAGSTVLASTREAVVFSLGRAVFYGCLRALGRIRLLLDASSDYFSALAAVRLAGRFVALEPVYDSPQYVSEDARLYDLSSGRTADLAGVSWAWNGGPIVYGLDSLALAPSGFAAWRQTAGPAPQPIGAVACPSSSLCVAGDLAGNILTSNNPTGGAQAWSVTHFLSNEQIVGVACPSISLCVAAGVHHVLSTTDPSGGPSGWTSALPAPSPYLYGISCPSVSLCVAGGGGATIHGGAIILTSTNPTGGASSWTSTQVASGDEIVEAVSCPSVSLCVATTNDGAVFTSTNPTGGASAWTRTTLAAGALSCPSTALCVAAGDPGTVLTSTHPAGGATTWTSATIGHGYTFTSISCPSVSLCVAGDPAGNIFTSTDPTGGASAWTRATVDRGSLQGNAITAVSCSSFLCVAADGNGNILTSTDPTGGAKTWTTAEVDIPGCAPRSRPCISEQLYGRDDQGARVIDTAPPGHGNAIGSIALDGNSVMLRWTHDGAPRQLALR